MSVEPENRAIMAIIVKPHLRLAWGGTLGTPASEVWTNSLAFSGVTDADSEAFDAQDMKDQIGAMATVLSTWFADSYAGISRDAVMTWVKFNKIGVDGKYIDNPNTLLLATPVPGGKVSTIDSGMFTGPLWQQSSVISLLTGAARGRGSRGRIYPPACGSGPGPDGYMQAAFASSMQTSFITMIGNLNKVKNGARSAFPVDGPRWNACIVSNGVRSLPGLLTPITRAYVDRVPDVQRRRVNRLAIASVAPTTVFINT